MEELSFNEKENINLPNISFRFVDDLFDDCFKHLKQNFESICPFQLTNGYDFQIRMSEETFSQLPEKYKKELKKFARTDAYDESDKSEVTERYRKDFFWITCKEYIFNFEIKSALNLCTNCEYGPEGMEDCVAEVTFINKKELTPFILLNINLDSDQKPKYLSDAPARDYVNKYKTVEK